MIQKTKAFIERVLEIWGVIGAFLGISVVVMWLGFASVVFDYRLLRTLSHEYGLGNLVVVLVILLVIVVVLTYAINWAWRKVNAYLESLLHEVNHEIESHWARLFRG
jgi:Flp pilus assembly pilin Flp